MDLVFRILDNRARRRRQSPIVGDPPEKSVRVQEVTHYAVSHASCTSPGSAASMTVEEPEVRSTPLVRLRVLFAGRPSTRRSLSLALLGLMVFAMVLSACSSATSPAGRSSAPAAPPVPASADSAAVAKGGA